MRPAVHFKYTRNKEMWWKLISISIQQSWQTTKCYTLLYLGSKLSRDCVLTKPRPKSQECWKYNSIVHTLCRFWKKYSLWLICCRFIVIFGECIVVYIAVRHLHKSQKQQQSYAADICHCRCWHCCGWCYRNFQHCLLHVVIYRMLL